MVKFGVSMVSFSSSADSMFASGEVEPLTRSSECRVLQVLAQGDYVLQVVVCKRHDGSFQLVMR